MTDMLDGVTWYRGSSVRIRRAGLEIHVDPLGVREQSEADYVLLTHPHFDNFSEEDIAKVRAADTVVIAPATMKKQIGDADHLMRPGDMLHLEGLDVLAVPAYNVDKRYHEREQGWLGYVFTVGEVTYYHAGDTDLVEEMDGIRCDVAFLPCDGHYAMSAEDAAKAGEICGAEIVVPIRWGEGSGSGSHEHAEKVSALFPGEVRILERVARAAAG